MIDLGFWRSRKVFLTGHTGFKGAWTCLLLRRLGAEVHGFALPPDSDDGVFVAAGVERDVRHCVGDVRDFEALRDRLTGVSPSVVLHMAAQALVRRSYDDPVDTYSTNVMGTVNVLEAARQAASVEAVVVVTSDKCYENSGLNSPFRETDVLGGRDPYSSSKACAELVTQAYRSSFFFGGKHRIHVASARAGNVIGGGDWARDRLAPDAMRAFLNGDVLRVRNPDAVRPWQHVLDPIFGYVRLCERLAKYGDAYADAWNFGPAPGSEKSVGELADELARQWGNGASWRRDGSNHFYESAALKLDCSKAAARLNWRPCVDLEDAIRMTVAWHRAQRDGQQMRAVTLDQIDEVLLKLGVSDRHEGLVSKASPSKQTLLGVA